MKSDRFEWSIWLLSFLICTCGIALAETTNLPSGIGIELISSDTTTLGADLVWTLSLTNSAATSRTCRITMDANSFAYDGTFLGDVSLLVTTNVLPSGGTNTSHLKVVPSEYTNWSCKSSTFELTAFVGVDGTSDRWIGTGRTILTADTNLLSIAPTPPITKGHSCTATVSYVNPFPSALHNVTVYLTADEGMSTNNALREDTFNVGTVATNGVINVSTNYIPGQTGTHNISVLILADELEEVSGFSEVEVIEE